VVLQALCRCLAWRLLARDGSSWCLRPSRPVSAFVLARQSLGEFEETLNHLEMLWTRRPTHQAFLASCHFDLLPQLLLVSALVALSLSPAPPAQGCFSLSLLPKLVLKLFQPSPGFSLSFDEPLWLDSFLPGRTKKQRGYTAGSRATTQM